MAKRATYHHGDLRRVLLDASLALVEEAGASALSLREVARKAGVSHNAPYHHFPDKASLMAAIAEEGFAMLANELASERAAAGVDALARLRACGTAYVRFAVASPAHFRVMFRPELASMDAHPAVFQASTGAFEILVGSVVECQAAGMIPAGDPMPFVLTCWASVHGLASLWLDGPLSLDPKGFGRYPEKLATTVVTTFTSLLEAARAGGRSDADHRREDRGHAPPNAAPKANRAKANRAKANHAKPHTPKPSTPKPVAARSVASKADARRRA